MRFCVTWNTNSRHCHEAQAVLSVLLRHEAPEELLTYEGVRASLEALLPYTGTWDTALGGGGESPGRALWIPLTSSVIPRTALPAARPDPAGCHLPRLPVAQHEAAHPPRSPLCPLKHREAFLFVCIFFIFVFC